MASNQPPQVTPQPLQAQQYPNPFMNGPSTTHTHAELSAVWDIVAFNLNPLSSTLSLTGEMYKRLDDGGKYYMAQRLMIQTGSPVLFVRDGSHDDRYLLGPVQELVAGNRFLVNFPVGIPILLSNTSQQATSVCPTQQIAAHQGKDPAAFMASYTMARPVTAAAMDSIVGANPLEPGVQGIQATGGPKIPRPANAWILYRKHNAPIVKAQRPELTNNEISQFLSAQWKNESLQVRDQWKATATDVKKRHKMDNPGYQYRPRRSNQIKRRPGAHKKTVAHSQGSLETTRAFTITSSPQSFDDADDLLGTPNSMVSEDAFLSNGASDQWSEDYDQGH